MTTPIKSTAAHVLSTGEATDAEAKSLAAFVLGDAQPQRTTRSREDLERILSKIEGQEGQSERVREIRAQMERM
jgi:hypothetical protein